MTPEQWQKVKEVFEAALECELSERSAFLGQACAENESVRGEVESLLRSYGHETDFMETPAAAQAPRLRGCAAGTFYPFRTDFTCDAVVTWGRIDRSR